MAGVARNSAAWHDSGAYDDYSSTGNYGYIPQIWSRKMVEAYYNASVLPQITSTDYDGEIKAYGDSVIIRTVPDVSINNYEVGQPLTYAVPTSDKVTLDVNKAKSWALTIDKIDEKQSDLNLIETFTQAAMEQMKVVCDTDVLSQIKGTAAATNKGLTAGTYGDLNLGANNATSGTDSVAITAANAIDYILKHGQALDEQSAPEQGRWMVIPAAFARFLKSSDLKDASITGDNKSVLRNGRLGMIDRFTIYTSNNLPVDQDTVPDFTVYSGVPSACAFASGIVENEVLPNPDSFGQLMRGLQVYGYKTVKAEGVTEGVVKF